MRSARRILIALGVVVLLLVAVDVSLVSLRQRAFHDHVVALDNISEKILELV